MRGLNHVSHLLAHAIMVYSLRRPAITHRFEVEEILNAKTDDNGAVKYLVKWNLLRDIERKNG